MQTKTNRPLFLTEMCVHVFFSPSPAAAPTDLTFWSNEEEQHPSALHLHTAPPAGSNTERSQKQELHSGYLWRQVSPVLEWGSAPSSDLLQPLLSPLCLLPRRYWNDPELWGSPATTRSAHETNAHLRESTNHVNEELPGSKKMHRSDVNI